MANSETCEWGDCDNIATHRARFVSPVEEVTYCRACLPEVRAELDYQRLDKL